MLEKKLGLIPPQSFLDSLKGVYLTPCCFDVIISVDHACKLCFLHLSSKKDPDVVVDKLGNVLESCFKG